MSDVLPKFFCSLIFSSLTQKRKIDILPLALAEEQPAETPAAIRPTMGFTSQPVMFADMFTTGFLLPDFDFTTDFTPTMRPLDFGGFPTTMPVFVNEATTALRDCPETDIVLLVQNSKSVDWRKFSDFMRDLADRLILRQNASRLAILSYSRTANEHISFTDYAGKSSLFDRINEVEKGGRNNAGGHLVDKGIKYISDDMFQDVRSGTFDDLRKLRSNSNIVILVLLSSSSRSDPIEIQQTISSLDRRLSSIRASRAASIAELHVIHSNKVSSSQLNAFITDSPNLVTKLHNIGAVESDGLRRFQFDREIFDPIGVCLTFETINTTPEMLMPTTMPIFFDADPTEDYLDTLESSTELLTTLTTIISESPSIIDIPPPPPPMFPPAAPPHINRIILSKESQLDVIQTTEVMMTLETSTTVEPTAVITTVTTTMPSRDGQIEQTTAGKTYTLLSFTLKNISGFYTKDDLLVSLV